MAIKNYLYQKEETGFLNHLDRLILGLTASLFFLISTIVSGALLNSQEKLIAPLPEKGMVKGMMVNQISPTPSLTPTITPTPGLTLTPTPTAVPLTKDWYTIAIIGDSMVDTMGERLEYLEHSLVKKYPKTRFKLYNYGRGSTNVEEALEMVDKEFKHQDRHYPPITEIKPDIIIVGSFAYNPFYPYDRNRHWLGLTRLVQAMEKITPNVYILAEIAPLREGFGRGPMGVNWPRSAVRSHTKKIIDQLENAVGLSKALNLPLIDAFDQSLSERGKEGKAEYISQSDNIHPSVEGHQFMADLIAEKIRLE